MKWFKHYATLGRKDFSQRLIKKGGLKAYARYILLLETCTMLHGDSEDGSYAVPKTELVRILGARAMDLRCILEASAEEMGFSFDETEHEFVFKIPILLELRHKDSISWKKRRASGGPVAGRLARLDKELDLELEKEKEKEEEKEEYFLPATQKRRAPVDRNSPEKLLNSEIWKTYLAAYQQRYRVDPVRNARTNAQIDQLRKRLGQEAIDVVKFFLTHNDSYYLKTSHSIAACVRDCESLRTQMIRGRAVTGVDIKRFEKASEFRSLMESIERGEI